MISKEELAMIRAHYLSGNTELWVIPKLLGEIERLQAELDEKDRLLRSVRDFMAQYNECPECESKIGPEYACDPKCTCSILMEWLRTTV